MTKEVDTNGAIQRAFSIFHVLFNADEGLNVAVIAERCGLPKTTTFRILNTLCECGALTKDADGNYRLGLLFALYGEKVKSETDLVSVAKPLLAELRDNVQETVNLSVLYEKKYVVNIVTLPGESFILTSRTLPISPLHCSAMGKLFLTDMTLQEIQGYFRAGFPQRTSRTITTYEQFLPERERIAASRIALDNEEYEYGLQCAAAPIFDFKGKIIAAISTTGPITRLSNKGLDLICDQVKQTAEKITRIAALAHLTAPSAAYP